MKKIAFIGKPHYGGGYTRFCYLRRLLSDHKLYLLGIGKTNSSFEIKDKDYFVIANALSQKLEKRKITQLFLDFVEKEEINIIIPMNSPIAVGAIPFISNAKIIQIVNSDTPRVYQYTATYIEWVSKVVCLTDKQVSELKKRISIQLHHKITIIPHGVDIIKTDPIVNKKNKLTIGFLGRVHQGHKNILLIPEILSRVNTNFEFHICGDGPDKKELLNRIEINQIPYIDHGAISNHLINDYLSKWDILLFPSFVEGFGITLIEAMNNGVVPIANILEGITDTIIDHNKNGFLVKNNAIFQYVDFIHSLDSNRELLHNMKLNAKAKVREKYDLNVIVEKYREVFDEVSDSTKPKEAIGFDNWKPYKEYKPSIYQRIRNRLF